MPIYFRVSFSIFSAKPEGKFQSESVLHVIMIESNFTFLLREGVPARLDVQRAAKLLGFCTHDFPILIGAGLLKPLGSPSRNGPKNFALIDILSHAADRDWLNRATKILGKHWQRKNDEQRSKRALCKKPSIESD